MDLKYTFLFVTNRYRLQQTPSGAWAKPVGHYGTHTLNLLRVAQHDEFAPLVRRIVQWLYRAGRPPAASLHSTMYCKSGNHRSVALAELLAYAAKTTGLCVEVETDHLCDFRWPSYKCRVCAACDVERPAYSADAGVVEARRLLADERRRNLKLFKTF